MSAAARIARTAAARLATLADNLDTSRREIGMETFLSYRLQQVALEIASVADLTPAPRSPTPRPAPRSAFRR